MFDTSSPWRRFIAGATCPRCGRVDKLYLAARNGQTVRACVRCGFEEAQPENPGAAPQAVQIQDPREVD